MTDLSARQHQCLVKLADGLTDRELAQDLHVSIPTVRRHIEDVRSKLGARNRTHAVALGFRLGVLP